MKAYVRESGGTALNLSVPPYQRAVCGSGVSGGSCLSYPSNLRVCHIFIFDCVNLKMCLPDGFQEPNIRTKFSVNWSAGSRFEIWHTRLGEVERGMVSFTSLFSSLVGK